MLSSYSLLLRLPIGYAVLREGCKRTTYYIYRDALDAYKKNMKMLGGKR